jgi:hypothetical protein
MLLEAVSAVDRSAVFRLERHFALFLAFSACRFMHLSRCGIEVPPPIITEIVISCWGVFPSFSWIVFHIFNSFEHSSEIVRLLIVLWTVNAIIEEIMLPFMYVSLFGRKNAFNQADQT